MTQWFVQSGEEARGPFTPSQVLDLVRRGQIVPTTKLRKDDSAWFVASEIGGLFEAAVKPTVRFRCPVCGSEVKQPPCSCPQCGRDIDMARREVIQHRIEVAAPGDKPPTAPGNSGATMQSWLSRIRRRRDS